MKASDYLIVFCQFIPSLYVLRLLSYVVGMQIRHILTHIIYMVLIAKQNAISAQIRLT